MSPGRLRSCGESDFERDRISAATGRRRKRSKTRLHTRHPPPGSPLRTKAMSGMMRFPNCTMMPVVCATPPYRARISYGDWREPAKHRPKPALPAFAPVEQFVPRKSAPRTATMQRRTSRTATAIFPPPASWEPPPFSECGFPRYPLLQCSNLERLHFHHPHYFALQNCICNPWHSQ